MTFIWDVQLVSVCWAALVGWAIASFWRKQEGKDCGIPPVWH